MNKVRLIVEILIAIALAMLFIYILGWAVIDVPSRILSGEL